MKTSFLIPATLFLAVSTACGQGTLLFDQQSVGEGAYGIRSTVQADYPPNEPPRIGQSFTPTLSSVGFIRLALGPADSLNGTTLLVHLRAGSITGTILGSTELVSLVAGSFRPTNLFFASPVPVTPGQTYFFDLEIPQWRFDPYGNPTLNNHGLGLMDKPDHPYNYSGGTAFYGGQPQLLSDLWFREGIVVPEPEASALLGVGTCLLLCKRKSQGMVRGLPPGPAGR